MIALLALLLVALPAGAAGPAAAKPSPFPLAPYWSVDIGAPPVANAPPIADRDRIYVALRTGQIAARAIATGAEVWRRDLATEQPLAADGGFVFVAGPEAIHALRGVNGSIAWEHPLPALTAPLLATGGWLIAAGGGKVIALRSADGTQVWEQDIGPVRYRPAIDGDRLYLPIEDGRIVAIDLPKGTTAWERQIDAKPGEPLAAGDRVYVGGSDKLLHCLKAADGDPDWMWRTGATVVGHPVIDEHHLYFVALDNVVRALDRISGVQQWQQAIRRRAAASPAVAGGVVLLPSSSSGEIYAWSTTSGRRAGLVTTAGQPVVPPEVSVEGTDVRLVTVTGSLAGVWELTMIGPVGDPPLTPLTELPGLPLVVDPIPEQPGS